ncbi:MAG: LPS assembly lipoprotein LptE [Pirellulaceae bacterium]
MRSRYCLLPTAFFLLLLSGCAGWHVGNRSLYRPDITTVHVPIVESDSFRRNLGERLTEMIVKEIELKTPYKVVDAASADSVLAVRIASENKKVLTETRNDDVRDMETDFFAQMSWSDRRGDLISGGGRIPFAPLLVNISQQANFVPEGGQSLVTAQQEALQRLAEQIVGQMERDVLAGCAAPTSQPYYEPEP